MAHYAADCYDAEILTTHGWIECVGIADRACYDLTVHSKKARLSVFEAYPEPITKMVLTAKLTKGLIGKTYGSACQTIVSHFETLDEDSLALIDNSLKSDQKATVHIGDKSYELTPQMITIEKKESKVTGTTFVPNVIEPSFGIGRIIYCLFEHSFNIRDNRRILSLVPHIAPLKCSVLPLQNNQQLLALVPRIVSLLTSAGLSNKVDTVQSIGRRYSRTDEIGIPFAVTIDFDTLKDDTVTLRDRDNTAQIRVKIDEVAQLVLSVIEQRVSWKDLEQKYPKYESKDLDDKD
jgi:glycyl-tRNA synthetase